MGELRQIYDKLCNKSITNRTISLQFFVGYPVNLILNQHFNLTIVQKYHADLTEVA